MTKLYFATEDALAVLTLHGDRCRCEWHLPDRSVQCVAVDPLQPQIVYAGTADAGLWRSRDAGQSWRPVANGIKPIRIQSIAVSRSERANGKGVVYAGTEPSTIFRSADGGDSWHESHGLSMLPSAGEWSFPPRPDTHHVRWIEPDPHLPGHLYVAIEAGALIRTRDAGQSWLDRMPEGPRDTHQVPTHLAAPGRLYAAAGDGYFESRDGGQTWHRQEEGLQHHYLWSVAVDAGDPDIRILSAAASARHSHYDEQPESFIYRRAGDAPWQPINVDAGLPAPTGRHSSVLAAHPQTSGTFFAAWERDVFQSTDGGNHWTRLDFPWPRNTRINEICSLAIAEL